MNTYCFSGLTDVERTALSCLAPMLGFAEGDGGVRVTVEKGAPGLRKTDGGVRLLRENEASLWRLTALIPEFLKSGKATYDEKSHDGMLCFMGDQSRNAVYNLPTAKRMLRYLAVLGYNAMMLYTEDTYAVPEYPSFGHMRGRFSEAELRELDDYAASLGIELIPCIQTLAHLETALRRVQLKSLQDTENILLTESEETLAFLDACMRTCKRCFRTKRIHIGMDEAVKIGFGKAFHRDGFRPAPERMLRHLGDVMTLCKKHGYEPMMWSDMFFRMAFGGVYYIREGEVPQDVIDRVPPEVSLVYWDYYSGSREVFSHMIDCHEKFPNELIFAGGAWTWGGFAPHNRFSLRQSAVQLAVCRERGIRNVIVTAWGDNGGECGAFSMLPVLVYDAETLYGEEEPDEAALDARCRACFGLGWQALLTLDAPNELPTIPEITARPVNPSRYLLFNDPLEGLLDLHMDRATVSDGFAASAARLRQYESDPEFGYLFTTLARLCELLRDKATLSLDLREAYLAGQKDALTAAAQTRIPKILDELEAFLSAYRAQWYRERKTFGFGVQELRLGGLRERLNSLRERLLSYGNGETDAIEELEAPVLPFATPKECAYIYQQNWHDTVTPGVL